MADDYPAEAAATPWCVGPRSGKRCVGNDGLRKSIGHAANTLLDSLEASRTELRLMIVRDEFSATLTQLLRGPQPHPRPAEDCGPARPVLDALGFLPHDPYSELTGS